MNHQEKQLLNSAFKCYEIDIDSKNRIISLDQALVKDFPFANTNSGQYNGITIKRLLSVNRKFNNSFFTSLEQIIDEESTGLCLFSSAIRFANYLALPATFIFLVTVEKSIVLGKEVKHIRLYNILEIYKFIQKMFCDRLLPNVINTVSLLKNNLGNKSIFFAYEALKELACFMPSKKSEKQNKDQLADLVFPFHNCRQAELTNLFTYKFNRPNGYLEVDKYRNLKQIPAHTMKLLAQQNFVAFSSLHENIIFKID